MWITIFALTFATAITFGVASVMLRDRPAIAAPKGCFAPPTGSPGLKKSPSAAAFQFVPGDCKNAISLLRSSADASPPYGFILLPGTTSSGFAMKLLSFSSSHTKSAPFMALE